MLPLPTHGSPIGSPCPLVREHGWLEIKAQAWLAHSTGRAPLKSMALGRAHRLKWSAIKSQRVEIEERQRQPNAQHPTLNINVQA